MRRNSPVHQAGNAGVYTPSPTQSRRTSDTAWEEKWQNMVEHQKFKREQDAKLRQKLLEKQEMEEYIECTFMPKTRCSYKSRETEDILKLMNPLISEEERILKELNNIETSEQESMQKLSAELRMHIVANRPGKEEDLIRICERYREERLKELAVVKNRKLDIVGLLHDVERKYNVICAREHLSDDEMAKTGFNIDTCRRIKSEILDSVKAVDTLKDRSKVTSEIEDIIKKAKEDVERQRIPAYQRGFIPRQLHGPGVPMMKHSVMQPAGMQYPHPWAGNVGNPQSNGTPQRFVNVQGNGVPPTMTMVPEMPAQPPHLLNTVQATQNIRASPQFPPGAIPMNPQFVNLNGSSSNRAPQMFQRNIPRKLRQ